MSEYQICRFLQKNQRLVAFFEILTRPAASQYIMKVNTYLLLAVPCGFSYRMRKFDRIVMLINISIRTSSFRIKQTNWSIDF